MKKVAIIGGLGYVGQFLSEYLRQNFAVTVFGRKNLQVLGEEKQNLKVLFYKDAEKEGKFDVVINLAYSDTYGRKRNFEVNRQLVKLMVLLSRPDSVLIHASSLSVFGLGLENPVKLAPVSMRRDFGYVENKIHIENELLKKFSHSSLHIVRFGNVWGPGSASWLHGPADRIIYAHPFPDQAKTSFSNITDVMNICHFIEALIRAGNYASRPVFHHLAEFSEYSWAYIFDQLGSALNEQPLYRPFSIQFPKGIADEFNTIMSPVKPRALFERMRRLKKLSSWMNTLVDITPPDARQLGKRFPVPMYHSSAVADVVFSLGKQFKTETGIDWQPTLNIEESLAGAIGWLKESGYLMKEE